MAHGVAETESSGGPPTTRASRRLRAILVIAMIVIVTVVVALVWQSANGADSPGALAASAGASVTGSPIGTSTASHVTPPSIAGIATTATEPKRFGSITVVDHVLLSGPDTPLVYQIVVHYPAVSGLADAALQDRVNAQFRAPADRALAGFTADFAQYPPGSGDNGFAIVSDQIHVAGKLISVQFDTTFRFPGGRSLIKGTNALTIRLDTGERMSVSAMFTSQAASPDGARALALVVEFHNDSPDCDPSVSSPQVIEALGNALKDRDGSGVTVTLAGEGIQFSFDPGVVGPNACGVVVGTLKPSWRAAFVNPVVIALASGT